ncbi:lim and transglutaminase domain protein ltd-1-like [Mya arenaria]|uniref:lim and transglutaminase domain protein ltd-1-like n=1 Tax=Mya arenaria TaxID=6604 RepID=UPI0022E5255B|nr:lim and transglutaminase domain protein ltd-1-like [Mya arenaria]XP_052788216.1 lim and transglutaminase domain protein ltd-1-like [Mya arenaria]XP_052788217.1 lim and transglutaminase domain protein ltd-1-like [Mya arenaria]XP_052788218.1 lim and transglutaminase domain protein ltd-1-like [Mya arenaria]XP_052788219.1 lim and transglutaminase domain protein ltd-1-like [Mya arenaria]
MGCSSSSPDTNNNQPVAKKSPKAKSSGSNVGAENETNRKRENNHPELKQEPEIEDVDVPKTEHGYPVAKEPPDRKADIFNPQKLKGVEARARAAPDNLADSYEELIAYLTSECKNDVEKVRALFIWMANQEIDDGNYSNVTGSDTPRGIMKLMKDNRASYSSFFALLCRKAGIQCVIIDGYAKSAGYKVGDSDDDVKKLNNSWNAVYVAGGWRIVFPLWACSAVVGHSTGVYTKVEVKGKAVREKEVESSGKTIKHFNDYYFFTDPEMFIFDAFAKDKRWQLLNRPWDFAKYCDIPYVRRYYFDEKVDIRSKFSGRLVAKDGECHIEISCGDPRGITLDYELYYNHVESGREISSSLQLNNFVFLNRTGSRWDFGIRFPETGVYKLQIVGGKGYEGDMCAFKIRADEVKDDVKPLPFNPGKVGYGPTMDTELAGIKAISHKSGLVKMNIKKHMEFNFKLTKDIVVRTELLHSTISKEELQQYCVTTQRNRNVHVAVNVPEEGEYALALHAQQKNHSDYDNVCNYLLTSETGKKKRQRKWETPQEKKTRRNVTDLSKTRGTKNLSELESEIERFHKLDMEDKGELAKAEDALEYKKDRKELEDAMNRRHLETLEKAIARGEKSRFRDKLTKQLDEAKDIREHLLHLNKIAHDILEMKQPTISELRSYKIPQPIIQDIMRATFLMLGERRSDLEDWEDLQVLMGRLGKDSMIRRVRQFDTVSVQPSVQKEVEKMLDEHSEIDARKASAGAGTFYVWLRDVCIALGQQDQHNGTQVTEEGA